MNGSRVVTVVRDTPAKACNRDSHFTICELHRFGVRASYNLGFRECSVIVLGPHRSEVRFVRNKNAGR